MNKPQLKYIADSVYMMENGMLSLNNEYLDLLNVTDDERKRIEDAIYIVLSKLSMIKQSKVKDIGDHVDVDQVKRVIK